VRDAARGGRRPTAASFARRVAGVPARRLVPSALSGAVSVGCGIGLLATSGWLITRASLRPPVFVLSIAIGAVQAFALGRGVARYGQRLAVHDVSLEVLGKLRIHLFDVLEPLVPGGLGSNGSGDVVAGFVADTEAVAEALAKGITAAVDVAASVVLGALVVALVDPAVGGVLVLGAGVVLGAAFAATAVGRSGAVRAAAVQAELAGAVVETMRCAPELVAYGRQDLVEQRVADLERRASSAAARQSLGTGLGRAAVTWVAGATLAGVVATGLAAHSAHRLSGVMLAVVSFVALAVFDQCATLPAALAGTDAGTAAARRLERLGDREAPVREPDDDRSAEVGSPSAVIDGAELVLDGTTVLHGLSLAVPAGRRTALVGRSGAGKTSALHALLHFVECGRGRVSVGGVDVRDMTRAGIARHVGWMGEQAHVFAVSLADNLRLGRPGASDAECRAVLERVGLGVWADTLPDGLATALGPGGRPVSAGERQRLGTARALLGGGSVLLLDEPTAHLDPPSSGPLLTGLLEAAGARSVLVVTHEPGIGRLVDEVVTLDAGRVTARVATLRA